MITFKCCKGLPIEYESFLIQKYESYITSCRYIELYYQTYEINHMLVYKENCLIELLIFGNYNNTARWFNHYVDIDQHILAECFEKLFEENSSIKKIIYDASFKKYSLKKSILYTKCNDHIINLPSKIDDYYSALGKCTRKTTKKQKTKLLKDHPTVNFKSKFKEEIDEILIEKIMKLNFERMKHKGIIYGNTSKIEDIYKFSQHYGFVTYIENKGQIIAGTISYILNKKLFGFVVGHNNDYSKYSLGIMCQLYEIEESIEKELLEYHFLWGDNDYKKRLSAKPYTLFSYFIYRNYSIDYIFDMSKAIVSRIFITIRQTKHLKPVRDAVKNYRKQKWELN